MAVSRKGWDSFGRYLDQRMDTIVTCGENLHSEIVTVKIAQQNGVLPQGNQHLANQVKLQLPADEVSDQTIAMTVIEAMPHYDQLL